MSECTTFAVEDNEFFILERNGEESETSVHQGMDTAVIRIRALLGLNIDSKQLELSRITVGKESLTVQVIAWSEIATKLIQTES